MILRPRLSWLLFATAILATPAWSAPVVDGALDAGYGVARVTQSTQTSLGDATQADVALAGGSELDAAYGLIVDGVLHLFFPGNLMLQERGIEPGHRYDEIDVYVDSESGGQNPLRADNPAVGSTYHPLNRRAGLRFDAGFAPDHWFNGALNSAGPNLTAPYALKLCAATLPAGSGGAGGYLGQSSPGGPGTLIGGTNPGGVEAAIDNRNVAGVGVGCAMADGGGVTTGFELAIPLAAIGNPAGCVRVCALLVSYWSGDVSNQVLGPLPAGTCALGAPATVDFSAVPGDQAFEVCPEQVPARASSWGRLKATYR